MKIKKISVLIFFCFLISCTQKNLPTTNNLLDQILTKKVIRVGTTGDYKPFSFRNEKGEYEGIDIEMAQDLAKSLNAEVEFVPTSWPTLMQDFTQNKFDIVMGGVSKNLDRQKVGFFSKAYLSGGKTPIARCEEKSLFTSLADIDQAQVRVVVNPGGTNEKFVKANIKAAQVITYNDNKTIFEQIVDKKADVMITDSEEVQLISQQKPELCATMPGKTFDKYEKAYWMPRDLIFKEYVDAWLTQRQLNAKVDAIIKKHLPENTAL